MKTSAIKNVVRRTVVCLVAVAGVMVVAGCDEYDMLSGLSDWTGAGFRGGNFNQGLSPHADCRANPLDPRC